MKTIYSWNYRTFLFNHYFKSLKVTNKLFFFGQKVQFMYLNVKLLCIEIKLVDLFELIKKDCYIQNQFATLLLCFPKTHLEKIAIKNSLF